MKSLGKKIVISILCGFLSVTAFSACDLSAQTPPATDSQSSVCEHVYDSVCDSTCNLCGESRVAAKHVYDNACDMTCNVCGEVTLVPDHVYSGVCDANCNVCNAQRTAADHVYDNVCDKTCNGCGAERSVADHVYDNDCDKTCNVCGDERSVADHVYDNDCDKTCNACGDERSAADHVYDNDLDADCNVCGATREITEIQPNQPTADNGDLADMRYVSSKIINNWMVVSDLSLQSEHTYGNSGSAIKGSFDYTKGEAYTGNGGNQVWTALCLDLQTIYGDYKNLQGQSISFDLKLENCNPNPALSVMNKNEQRQTEYVFDASTKNSNGGEGITKEILDDEWIRITAYFDFLFDKDILAQSKYFVLVFSNVDCNEEENSQFYIDNVSINESGLTWFTETYNPDGYYTGEKTLTVQIVGNSFIYYSSTAQWLDLLGMIDGNPMNVSYKWIPNGRIPDQYEAAFGNNGWMDGEYTPDLVYVQDFYSFTDAFALSDFARTMRERSPNTEIKVYPGENETEDGIKAASTIGVDLVNWRAAIKFLKTQGYTYLNLNDDNDGWHPNILSGFVGALMIYMDLYGEIPDIQSVWRMRDRITGFYEKTIEDYLPGQTEAEKKEKLEAIFKLAKDYTGVSGTVCLHNWTATVVEQPTCISSGTQNNSCSKCGVSYPSPIWIRKHDFREYGSSSRCGICGVYAPADENDYAALAYLLCDQISAYTTNAVLEEQSLVVSENSTTAIKGTFSHEGADAYIRDGERQVWCVLLLDFTAVYEQEFANVKGKTITFDIKLENCGTTCSTLILDYGTNKSPEPTFDNTPTSTSAGTGYTKTILSNGWVRITAPLDSLFKESYLTDAVQFGIVFNNVNTDQTQPNIFYLDNIKIS